MRRARDFGAVDGDDTSDGAGAESSDNPGDEHEGRVLGGSLKRTTDHGEERRCHHAVDAAQTVCKPATDEAADDTSKVCRKRRLVVSEGSQGSRETRRRTVDRNDAALVDGIGDAAGRVLSNADFADVVGGGVDWKTGPGCVSVGTSERCWVRVGRDSPPPITPWS
jgi:hypothetical protein